MRSDPFDLYGEAVGWDDVPASTPAAARVRHVEVDALRGAVLLWMVGSHLSIFTGWFPFPRGWGWAVFVLISGALWRPRLGRRWFEVLGSGLLVLPVGVAVAGISVFNVLLAWGVMLPVFYAARRVPMFWHAVAGVVLLWWWPLGGANPGLLWLVWVVGRLLELDGVRAACGWLPRWGWLAWVGRHPLTVYVGHLWGFYLLT